MASLDHHLNPLFSIKECSSCGALYTADFCCSNGGLKDKILVPKPPQNCATYGDPVDGLYCRPCAFVRKCLNEGWYTILDENEILNTYESSNHNTNVVSAPQEPFVFNQDPGVNSSQSPLQINHNCCYECGDSLDDIFCQRCTCKFCGNGAHIGYNCPPKASIIFNLEQCNQTINELSQTLPSVHSTCNSGDENSFTYDSKPNFVDDSPNIFNPPPQPSMYSCELCGNDSHYGYDCPPQVLFDYTIAITPVLSTKEAVDSLIMEDEHLDTILATESDEVIKSSVENLVPIPSEFKGIFDDTCDVPVCEDPSTFDALSNHSKILSDSNNDGTSSDDDSYENIEYIEASPLNLEIVSLEEVNEDQEEKEFDLEDIFQIQYVILCEKLLNISRLVTNIKSLKDNPTPDRVLKSPFSSPIPIVDTIIRKRRTTTNANNSPPEYDLFLFEVESDQGGLISIVISDNSNYPLLEPPEFESFHFDLYDDPLFPVPPPERPDVEISLIVETDAPVINNVYDLSEDDDAFTFVIRTFLPFLTYPEVSPLLSSTGSEDTIFDPGISI
ncbi:hypothetical protein Tco_1031502 [Tanacetum coccineum]|uniref:CCHC-type domain-containing protein n=1 Tax=Tanacetum coccineum TaxID=301880 RepID=A0ABQ5G9K8_9ASTR